MKMKDTFKRYIAKINAHLDIRFPIGAILGVALLVWALYQITVPEPFGVGVMMYAFDEFIAILFCWFFSFGISMKLISIGWTGFKKTIFKNTKRQTTVVKLLSYKPGSYVLAQTVDGNILKLSGFDPDKTPHCFLKEDMDSLVPLPTEIFYVGENSDLQKLIGYKDARRCFLKKVNRG